MKRIYEQWVRSHRCQRQKEKLRDCTEVHGSGQVILRWPLVCASPVSAILLDNRSGEWRLRRKPYPACRRQFFFTTLVGQRGLHLFKGQPGIFLLWVGGFARRFGEIPPKIKSKKWVLLKRQLVS